MKRNKVLTTENTVVKKVNRVLTKENAVLTKIYIKKISAAQW
jgi:hypothetical protein